MEKPALTLRSKSWQRRPRITMMVMSSTGLMIGHAAAIIGVRSIRMPVTIIAHVGGDNAERQVFVIGAHTSLMLKAIDGAGHARTRKDERQRDAKHRAEPKWRKLNQANHRHPATELAGSAQASRIVLFTLSEPIKPLAAGAIRRVGATACSFAIDSIWHRRSIARHGERDLPTRRQAEESRPASWKDASCLF